MYSFDQDEGGDCSLIKQFKLVESPTVLDQNDFLETSEEPKKQGKFLWNGSTVKSQIHEEMKISSFLLICNLILWNSGIYFLKNEETFPGGLFLLNNPGRENNEDLLSTNKF